MWFDMIFSIFLELFLSIIGRFWMVLGCFSDIRELFSIKNDAQNNFFRKNFLTWKKAYEHISLALSLKNVENEHFKSSNLDFSIKDQGVYELIHVGGDSSWPYLKFVPYRFLN